MGRGHELLCISNNLGGMQESGPTGNLIKILIIVMIIVMIIRFKKKWGNVKFVFDMSVNISY